MCIISAGTNPIHNKKPKKKQTDEDDDDKAFKAKQAAGSWRIANLLQV
jgi:hypothetical protein